jgi:hypothetical protein
MMSMTKTYTVEITNVSVTDRYFSFDYCVSAGKHILDEGTYENDYENGQTREEWKKVLEDGYAADIAIAKAVE